MLLRLQPLPLGFHQRLRRRRIHPPVPPVKIARDAAGKPLRDAQGSAVTLADVQQPDYLAACERYHQRVAVLSLAEALRGDETIELETVPPVESATQGWEDYADALFAELEQAGFAAGDLVLLCREICRLSNLIDDHLRVAQGNFSSAANGDSA